MTGLLGRPVSVAQETLGGLILVAGDGDPNTSAQSDLPFAQAQDVATAVETELNEALARLVAAGVDARQVAFDPGLGFEKAHADSWRLLGATARFAAAERPWVVAASRKRFLDNGMGESVGAAVWAAAQGADVLRVHDVAETAGAIRAFLRAREAADV